MKTTHVKVEEKNICPCTGDKCSNSETFPNNCLGCVTMDNYFLEMKKDKITATA